MRPRACTQLSSWNEPACNSLALLRTPLLWTCRQELLASLLSAMPSSASQQGASGAGSSTSKAVGLASRLLREASRVSEQLCAITARMQTLTHAQQRWTGLQSTLAGGLCCAVLRREACLTAL